MTDDPDRLLSTTDDASGLTARLHLEHGDRDAVTAAVVEIANPTERTITCTVNTDVGALLLLEATDDSGHRLSRPARKFSSEEAPDRRDVDLEPGSSRAWRTDLADWIPAERVPAGGIGGRLVVSVTFTVDGRQVLLTVYDLQVRFSTR